MKFWILGSSAANSTGNHFGVASDKVSIACHEKTYGTGFSQICCCGRFPESKSGLSTDEISRFKIKNTRVSFKRKSKKISLDFISSISTEEFGSRVTVLSSNVAQKEMLDQLKLIGKKLKATDDFDFKRFYMDCEAVLGIEISSESEMKELYETVLKLPDENTDPWIGLKLDHPRFHENAREILDEPFYWSSGDELSPHGSDLGAGILDGFLEGHQQSSEAYLKEVIGSIDPMIVKSYADLCLSRDAYEKNPIVFTAINMAVVAVGLAEVKVSGTCKPEMAKLVVRAIDRQMQDYVDQAIQTSDKDLLFSRLKKMSKLFRSI